MDLGIVSHQRLILLQLHRRLASGNPPYDSVNIVIVNRIRFENSVEPVLNGASAY